MVRHWIITKIACGLIALAPQILVGQAVGQVAENAAEAQPADAVSTSPVSSPDIGDQLPKFALQDSDGRRWDWSELSKSRYVVVVFLGVECPLVKLYAGRLQEIQNEFSDDKVQIIGINSNQQDSLQEIQAFVRRNELGFPILKDPGNRVADAFGAERTPEVFVLDSDRTLVYHGAIDDQYTYGLQRAKVTQNHLRDALGELMATGKASRAESEFAGCFIGKQLKPSGNNEVTYANQISRILQTHCVSCHRPGEIGPFALTDYEEVVGWAAMIQEVVNNRRMPPWHADPAHGDFKNDARLTEGELELINRWVEAGAPLGDVESLPPKRQFTEGWQIGEPDKIFRLTDDQRVPRQGVRVPARGVIDYKYFVVDTGFTEDKWIKAAEARPGNREVVHHIIVAVQSEHRNQQSIHGDLESEFITATAPGAPPLVLPEGYAKRIPAGARLVFQMHYTPNGRRTRDISEVGLVFADPAEVEKEVVTMNAVNTEFTIKAGDANSRVPASTRAFEEDLLLLSLFPHMHLRGKDFKYILEVPGEQPRTLLSVPKYDFNWQNGYHLARPLRIPAGSRIRCVAHFDNSADNLANPAPDEDVKWGDQTDEEMMIGYFDVALADQDLRKTRQRQKTPLRPR